MCVLTGFLYSCASGDFSMDGIGKSMKRLFSVPEQSVVENDFTPVPFEMAINDAFDSQLQRKEHQVHGGLQRDLAPPIRGSIKASSSSIWSCAM